MRYQALNVKTARLLRSAKKLLCLTLIAVSVTACTSSTPASVGSLRLVTGNALPGTQGKTVQDQENIDDNVARGCAVDIYTKAECKTHTKAGDDRMRELR